MALSGRMIPGEVYAWTAVFILPINSALNPYLYTISRIMKQRVSIILWVPHADQEMLTLPEHLISGLVFIEVHVVLSFVSPYFML